MAATSSSASSSAAVSSPVPASAKASPATAYALFMHRAELQRKRAQFARVSQTKIQLTTHLINKLKQRMASCSYEDLQCLVREQEFKRNLEKKLNHRHKQLKAIAKQKEKRSEDERTEEAREQMKASEVKLN
ncbi:uncharacterized protein LOC117571990 [Drosophila albomicans]|uniref:Uncharacterized protein LOC117571990 n=1 Tax=Drosophila albomicans TaxID=7291 RepID=A0A6P8XCL3_DROAB|nr:uncharacterized protein LOC117571990 [Drosophila albomicans]